MELAQAEPGGIGKGVGIERRTALLRAGTAPTWTRRGGSTSRTRSWALAAGRIRGKRLSRSAALRCSLEASKGSA